MFRPRLLFQTRSADRDRQTDLYRRQAIADVLKRQRTEAEREMHGLQRRMNDAYQKAAFLLDNTEDYSSRSALDENEISQFEASAEAARCRIAELNNELGLFTKLERILKEES